MDSVKDALEPGLDLLAEIDQLRRERQAIILAHYYQEGEIQDIADVVGDSLQLAQAAARTEAKTMRRSSGIERTTRSAFDEVQITSESAFTAALQLM